VSGCTTFICFVYSRGASVVGLRHGCESVVPVGRGRNVEGYHAFRDSLFSDPASTECACIMHARHRRTSCRRACSRPIPVIENVAVEPNGRTLYIVEPRTRRGFILVVHSKKLSLLYSSDASAFYGHCGGGVVFDLDRKRPFCRDSNCHLPQDLAACDGDSGPACIPRSLMNNTDSCCDGTMSIRRSGI